MPKKVLFIAFHFPPMAASSGIQRTLKFVRYLRNRDWESIVLSASPRAYIRTGSEQLKEIPEGMRVARAFALDAARHLSIAGRYPAFAANPDRWASWLPFAVRAGKRLIRQERPCAIVSTYPIATAHLIGLRLADWSGLPWLADFRDSMYDDGYPADARERAIRIEVDRKVTSRCAQAVFTTEATRRMYLERYPDLPSERWSVIPNGYDEDDFERLATPTLHQSSDRHETLTLVHSGTLYPIERNPIPFFNALHRVREQLDRRGIRLRIRLRATGHDEHYKGVLRDTGLQGLVEIAEPLPYRAALKEMTEADALLLFQAEGCNHQIPAKVYEYLRAQKPIIALTDTAGDTAALLREVSADNLLPLEDEETLVTHLPPILDELNDGRLKIAPIDRVREFSREQGAADLAQMLDRLTQTPGRR